MKKLLVTSIVTLFFAHSILAQSEAPLPSPKYYLGLGTGLNSAGLLGIKSAFRLHELILIDAFAGLGTWGWKYGAGFVFNAKNKKSFCPAISLTHATGVNDILYTSKDDNNNSGDEVRMDLKPATMLNLTIQRHWVFKETNRLVFEFGYSFLLNGGRYEFTTPNFTPTSFDKQVWDLLRPGGISLGLAFYFGL